MGVSYLAGWMVGGCFFCEFASLEFLESASITSPRKISEVVKNTGVLSADEPEKRNTLMGAHWYERVTCYLLMAGKAYMFDGSRPVETWLRHMPPQTFESQHRLLQ